jgi:hypothetical protein
MPFRLFPSRVPAAALTQHARVLAVVLLGLQALLWGGGSIIEARAAAESLSRGAHIEDTGATNCPPIHSHLDCLICRTFASGTLLARERDLLPSVSESTGAMDRRAVSSNVDGRNGPLGSRAPPRERTRPA